MAAGKKLDSREFNLLNSPKNMACTHITGGVIEATAGEVLFLGWARTPFVTTLQPQILLGMSIKVAIGFYRMLGEELERLGHIKH
ncbi:MAG: hypothetical protein A49_14070 [Methyloceanibacter sp.]|nr:MAG: hypothetical protein A49_14070 [Methyloceanibacter sp.]